MKESSIFTAYYLKSKRKNLKLRLFRDFHCVRHTLSGLDAWAVGHHFFAIIKVSHNENFDLLQEVERSHQNKEKINSLVEKGQKLARR